jgi:addiction module RelE/StbE family toxin
MPKIVSVKKTFAKKAKKLLKRNSELKHAYIELYNKLRDDPFNPSLKTHGLSGNLKGRYTCSLTADIRIMFKLSDDTIHLLEIGSHDEVY